MLQVASKAIEPPAHDDIELATFRVRHEAIERGPAVLRAGHADIDVLDGRSPPARRNVASELGELIFRFLVSRRHASVDGSFTGNLQVCGSRRITGSSPRPDTAVDGLGLPLR